MSDVLISRGKMGIKGSWRRPMQISQAEYDLRWKFASGGMTLKEFERKLKKLREKENGRKEKITW